jgi:hypothetical protein
MSLITDDKPANYQLKTKKNILSIKNPMQSLIVDRNEIYFKKIFHCIAEIQMFNMNLR